MSETLEQNDKRPSRNELKKRRFLEERRKVREKLPKFWCSMLLPLVGIQDEKTKTKFKNMLYTGYPQDFSLLDKLKDAMEKYEKLTNESINN
ncbi:MAG: hypothetical protein ACFB0B_15520 [Thermonemataceae bacterium]